MQSLVGNKSQFAFELYPVKPSWDLRYGPEQTGWAGLAVWADGKNLCAHFDSQELEIQEWLYVPLGPIADWLMRSLPAIAYQERAPQFATDRALHRSVRRWAEARPPAEVDEDEWIDGRELWWSRHFLQSGADGALLPNFALVRDDEQLVLDWAMPFWVDDVSRLALNPRGTHAVPWRDGLAVIEEFVAEVRTWFRAHAPHVYDWTHAVRPGSLEQRVELLAGRPVGDVVKILGLEHGLEDLGLEPDSDPATSAELQVLRDLSPEVTEEVGLVMQDLSRRSRIPDDQARLLRNKCRDLASDAARSASSPEERGQYAAIHLRRSLGLDSEPIDEMDRVLDRFGVVCDHSDVPSHRDRLLVMLGDRGSAVAASLRTQRTDAPWGQRFEAARAAGHVLLDPDREGRIGAAGGPFAQRTRRRRSGAFAAELLLPETALAKVSENVLDGATKESRFESMMSEYGVGARTAAYQLWNRGWLSGTDVRDELIDRFAAYGWG